MYYEFELLKLNLEGLPVILKHLNQRTDDLHSTYQCKTQVGLGDD